MPEKEGLIQPHGGYRKLVSFQIAQLIYDITVRFCGLYIDRKSRTRDQMVQAARSGVQNIAEGSQASGTSKKTEIKLTNVARASLEELRLDYEYFLRQKGFPQLDAKHPALMRFKAKKCLSLEDVRAWAEEERKRIVNTASLSLPVPESPSQSLSVPACPLNNLQSSALIANAALSKINICCHLLDRQIASQAKSFENEGGFTERLYRVRTERRAEK